MNWSIVVPEKAVPVTGTIMRDPFNDSWGEGM